MILALDGGGNTGWSIVAGGADVAVEIVAMGVVRPPEFHEGVDLPQVITKPLGAFQLAAALSCLAGEHRCWRADESLGPCVAEDLEADLGDRVIDRVVFEEIGLHSGTVPAVVDNCLPVGVLCAIACLLGAELWTVSPKKWQRSVCPLEKGEKVDYRRVRDGCAAIVERLGSPLAKRQLAAIEYKHRTHPLDSAGIGTYFAVGDPCRRIA